MRFDGRTVLDGLDLAAAPGRSLVVLGASGAGKSVALKIAAGLVAADEGEVRLDGERLAPGAGHARRYGLLFQGGALFDSLPVWENVAFRLLNADRLARRIARDRALEALAQVRLGADVAERRPAELSGGMQKRVALARAIVAEPDILLFDEPTTGLDPATARAIDALIVEQVHRLGCTAVTITHDIDSTRRVADDVALLHAGRIAWRGSPAELDTCDDPRFRDFLGVGPAA
jgi:phospholipid/cholesterol/gamma-HCH transport system ATP-binding protein